MPIFCVKSVKIYTGQFSFTQTCLWCLWQISGMGQRSVSLEYQTCTSAYLFDTLVTGMVLAESFDIDEKSSSIICSNCALSFLYKYHNYQPSFSCSLKFFKDNSNHKNINPKWCVFKLKSETSNLVWQISLRFEKEPSEWRLYWKVLFDKRWMNKKLFCTKLFKGCFK